ncbi:probable protein phosphatase 2C 6 [Macadamia integrifolia]|uniref:probable protein phosphatase 2C 6 n=1 Tax=Macadamia integrifolia TaxID=60698 RepID=UPI001C4EF09F|nr:probable protein phosphatase 2C 6 [Macadamia integrifolia]XP_042488453.1 probable protein phosphatase 2C 6 [Macadamia integrifolia]XP_042488454.1 probable protein phosphatase 2C 6 [Macadamia integrifolia]XP_042488456.1 probable protein phosphatase 2C 6 [Macadamia integrifolia]XP_042488457.1 probable protein phosphatase 2C 6 [Macadamia integrifolia]XP_042488458.1 probable protein phosphatase 2C 6 [Macadamia integrifolia]XP_042488459.1 probable protein phosphatase 2C 6 [Macadamia integrifoli
MEEMSPAVAVPFRLGNSICDSSAIATHMEITRLKLITDTASMLSDPATKVHTESVSATAEGCLGNSTGSDGGSVTMSTPKGEKKEGEVPSVEMTTERETSRVSSDVVIQESEEDDSLSLGGDLVVDCSCSLSLGSDSSCIRGEELLVFETATELSTPRPMDVAPVQIIMQANDLGEPNVDQVPVGDILAVPTALEAQVGDGSDTKAGSVVLQMPQERRIGGSGTRSIFELDCVPLWGFTSICGRRPEMEDAVAAIPRFLKIPISMLVGDHVLDGMSQSLCHTTAHFFGVYDGHGGLQVANYCRDRIHSALIEEIATVKEGLVDANIRNNWQMQWERAFSNCFQKVDDEVGGRVSKGGVEGQDDSTEASTEPVAPETVGSTAVVAVICSSHIIVANCGDSRAVLCRGKEAVALSVDHKPNREDEFARIESAGGKVIQWNGYRVFGVLAMSRSIGDRYLKPWIIPEPEVKFVPRVKEDECLILASDGLWDVMTNEEVCEVARRRILLWHKKNGVTPPVERGDGVDPAAQAAAECLSKLALQKGSKDNITIVVVDLKAQRKFKSKS